MSRTTDKAEKGKPLQVGLAKIRPAKNTLLLPYQAAWVNDTALIKLAEKSRQIGWSWTASYGIVRRKAMATAQLDAWISSRDEIQAKLFLEDCLKFAKILDIGAEDLGEKVIDRKGNTAFILRLANTLKINSMSSNPNAQAGKRGDRILDEFALHEDPRMLYTIAYPGITWGGQLEIFSTHRGSANFFNELVREVREKGNPKNISLHRVTLQDALDQGFLFKLQGKLPKNDPRQEMDEAEYFNFIKAGCADEESFLQEYMCVPADDNSAFLTYDLIASCEYRENETWELPLDKIKNPLFVGVDVGRKHDLTVIYVLEFAGGRYLTRKTIEMKNAKFAVQEAALYDILSLPNMRRCCIDASGLGMQLAERAQEKFGKYRVEPVTFTGPVKEELAYPLKAAFEDSNIRIPFNKFLRADLRAIKKVTTAAGNIRFAADSGENGHSDRFWSLALGIHAAKGENMGPCKVESARANLPGSKVDFKRAMKQDFNFLKA
jgi:phage FluMu gp28-like protein